MPKSIEQLKHRYEQLQPTDYEELYKLLGDIIEIIEKQEHGIKRAHDTEYARSLSR